jgi:hypothetical protein
MFNQMMGLFISKDFRPEIDGNVSGITTTGEFMKWLEWLRIQMILPRKLMRAEMDHFQNLEE